MMTRRSVSAVALVLLLLSAVSALPAESISVRQVRSLLQHLGGGDLKPEQVQIRKISRGIAGDVIVEAQIETAWRMVRDRGEWRVAEVRLGDRHWESLELVEEAVRREKVRRTGLTLQELGGAIAAYRREEGHFPTTGRIAELLDALAPRYISNPRRFDWWGRQFEYEGEALSYRLRSAGADGRFGTADDLVEMGESGR